VQSRMIGLYSQVVKLPSKSQPCLFTFVRSGKGLGIISY